MKISFADIEICQWQKTMEHRVVSLRLKKQDGQVQSVIKVCRKKIHTQKGPKIKNLIFQRGIGKITKQRQNHRMHFNSWENQNPTQEVLLRPIFPFYPKNLALKAKNGHAKSTAKGRSPLLK